MRIKQLKIKFLQFGQPKKAHSFPSYAAYEEYQRRKSNESNILQAR
jgi:hypothetical protein